MARTCSEYKPICSAVAAAPTAIDHGPLDPCRVTPTHHSSTRMPPIEPPTTAAHREMPRWSANNASTRTWSRMVMMGKRDP